MRRSSPATCSRRSSAAWSRRSDWPSSKATPRSCSSRTVAPTGRSCSTRSRPPTSPSGVGCGASTRRRPVTATRAGWLPSSTSSCSSITAPSSGVASPVGTSWPDRTSSSSTGCSRAPAPPSARANGFALFTAAAVDALGLDPDALGLRPGEESIEHLGHVDTFTLDLEARWQAESGERRLDIAEADVVFDVEATLAARALGRLGAPDVAGPPDALGGTDPSSRRPSAGGRRGVGTHGPVRDRPTGDARGDRRLAALRPRRMAAGGSGRRAGGGDGRPRSDRERDPAPAPLGLPGRVTRRMRPRSSRSGPRRRPPSRASARSSPAPCRSSSSRPESPDRLDIRATPRFADRMRIGELADGGRRLDRHGALL